MSATTPAVADRPIRLTRRRMDSILTSFGVLSTIVLAIAGSLLMWGSSFAKDYVSDELTAQGISFPEADALRGQGRDDLVKYGGELVDTGPEAEAYSTYIGGHIEGIADGETYAGLGSVERAANSAVNEAIANGAPAAEIAELEAAADQVTQQRESIFRGEMLRGALLNTFAWYTIGRIAGIAGVVAIICAVVMAALTLAGFLHLRKIAS